MSDHLKIYFLISKTSSLRISFLNNLTFFIIINSFIVNIQLNVYITYLYFSFTHPVELRRRAVARMKWFRGARSKSEHSILIPRTLSNIWGVDRILDKRNIMNVFCGWKPEMNRRRDDACMKVYLENVNPGGLQDPGISSLRDLLPVSSPLLDFLAVGLEDLTGWKFPTPDLISRASIDRSPSYKMLEDIEVREIIVGVTPPDEVKRIHGWIKHKMSLDRMDFPAEFISMDVEDLRVSSYDWMRMVGELPMDNEPVHLRTSVHKERIGSLKKDKFRQLPVLTMIGNGLTWALMISLDLIPDGFYNYKFTKMSVQSELLDLLRGLPPCVGLGVSADVHKVEQFFSDLSGENVELKGPINLSTLAVLAGWKLQARGMTAMGMQVLGACYNKCCSTADDQWGKKWNEIPKALQVYALSDLKLGYLCFVVLAGILLRDLFPDPDIVCQFIASDQIKAASWFSEFLIYSLSDIEVHEDTLRQAETREEMIKSMRFRPVQGGKLCKTIPIWMFVWCKLLGPWPSITHGGCRYLLLARSWFCEQIRVLKKCKILWADGFVVHELTKEEEMQALYGIRPEQLVSVNWSEPTTGTIELNRPGSLPVQSLKFNPMLVKPVVLARISRASGRFQRVAILEWAHHHPQLITTFLDRMRLDPDFKDNYRGIYDALRLLYRRLYNALAPTVDSMDTQLILSMVNVRDEEKARVDKLMIEVIARQKRIKFVDDIMENGEFQERSRWQARMPPLPGAKPTKSKKRRRKSRKGSNKRLKGSDVIALEVTELSDSEFEDPAPILEPPAPFQDEPVQVEVPIEDVAGDEETVESLNRRFKSMWNQNSPEDPVQVPDPVPGPSHEGSDPIPGPSHEGSILSKYAPLIKIFKSIKKKAEVTVRHHDEDVSEDGSETDDEGTLFCGIRKSERDEFINDLKSQF